MFTSFIRFLGKLDDLIEALVLGLFSLSRRYWLACCLAMVPTFAYLAYQPRSISAEDRTKDSVLLQKYLTGRPFFDEYPNRPEKRYRVYFFNRNGTGAYFLLERYKQVIEIFFYSAIRGKIYYWFPHSKLKGSTVYSLKECRGPGNFDIRIEFKQDPKAGGKQTMYYSWKNYKQQQPAVPKAIRRAVLRLQEQLSTIDQPQKHADMPSSAYDGRSILLRRRQLRRRLRPRHR